MSEPTFVPDPPVHERWQQALEQVRRHAADAAAIAAEGGPMDRVRLANAVRGVARAAIGGAVEVCRRVRGESDQRLISETLRALLESTAVIAAEAGD